jgi:short-subunit dehydrogenase
MDWSKKVVLITGASSGIGRALSIELARRGATIGMVARRHDILKQIVNEIKTAGGLAIDLPADVTDRDAIHLAAQTLLQNFGHIDVLIASAGISTTTSVNDLCEIEAAKVIDVNLIGVINSITAVLPHMRERKAGHLVGLSSLAAYRGLPKSAIYCASKAAVSALFESLRIDLKTTGIDVTILHPGFIKTPSTATRKRMPFLLELDQASAKMVRAIEKRKQSYAFPWQLATIVRACLLLPASLYDAIAKKTSFRE